MYISMSSKVKFRLFFFFMALFCLGANFAHPITPTLIKNLGLPDSMFGAAFAAMMVTNFLFSPFWGMLNDRVETRYLILIGCLGYGISQLGFAVATTALMILFARLCAGVFTGAIFVSFLSYIVSESGEEERSGYLTINATVQNVFGPFGYLIGGLLGEISISLVFVIQATVLITSGCFFFLVCTEKKKNKKSQPASIGTLFTQSNPFRAFLACRSFMTASFAGIFAICIFMYIGQTAFDQAFNYFLKAQLNLGSSYNGIIKAVVGLVSFVSNVTLCFAIIRRRQSKKAVVILNGISTLLCGILLFLNQTVALIVCGIFLYCANSVSVPLIQDIIAQKAKPSQENLIMGFYNGAKSLGSIAGAMIAGASYSWNAYGPFLFAVLFFLLSLFLSVQFLTEFRFLGKAFHKGEVER